MATAAMMVGVALLLGDKEVRRRGSRWSAIRKTEEALHCKRKNTQNTFCFFKNPITGKSQCQLVSGKYMEINHGPNITMDTMIKG